MDILTKSVLIPIALMVLNGFIFAWINMKVKFAKNEAEAMVAIRHAIFGVCSWAVQLLGMGYVGFRWYSGEPISRLEVIVIALIAAWLAVVVITFLMAKYYELWTLHFAETYKLHQRIEVIENQRSLKG